MGSKLLPLSVTAAEPEHMAAPRPTAPETEAAFRAGFLAGVKAAEAFRAEALREAERELTKFKETKPEFYADLREKMAALFEERARLEPWPASVRASAMAEVLRRDLQGGERAVLEQLSRSRSRALERQRKDLEDVVPFAELIRGGEVTKTAADRLKIGMVRAKRLRELAIGLGLLPSRRR